MPPPVPQAKMSFLFMQFLGIERSNGRLVHPSLRGLANLALGNPGSFTEVC